MLGHGAVGLERMMRLHSQAALLPHPALLTLLMNSPFPGSVLNRGSARLVLVWFVIVALSVMHASMMNRESVVDAQSPPVIQCRRRRSLLPCPSLKPVAASVLGWWASPSSLWELFRCGFHRQSCGGVGFVRRWFLLELPGGSGMVAIDVCSGFIHGRRLLLLPCAVSKSS